MDPHNHPPTVEEDQAEHIQRQTLKSIAPDHNNRYVISNVKVNTTNQLTNKLLNQPTIQPTNQQTNQPTNKSTNQPMYKPSNQTINH